MKSESNLIDHGPVHPVKLKGNLNDKSWSRNSNSLHDIDNYQLQDLSLDNYGIKFNDDVNSNHIFASERKKEKQTQRTNVDSSFTKKGKEKKTDVMDDRMQVQSKSSYYITNKMKNANMSANYMKKKKKYYYNKEKYNKYEKNKKKKQEYYGWMKYMKP